MTDLTLALRITGDAGQLKAEIAGANATIAQLGPVAQQSAASAGQALSNVGTGAQRAGAGVQQYASAQQQAAAATGLTSNQLRQLSPQLNDIFTQLALGQSPLMILAAQGGQITQIFGGVKATMSALVGVLGGPLGVAALGAAAGLGAIALQAERQERALIANSLQLRRTRDDYAALAQTAEDVAKRISQSSTLSTDDARGAALSIAGQRRFGGDGAELERLTRLAADLAKVMGVDAPAAAERFISKAIADPARAAREAADGGMRGFDEALVRQVQRLQASGETGRATTLVLEGFGRAAGGAAGEMTQLQSAWTTLMNSIKAGLEGTAEAAAAAILRFFQAGRSGAVRDYADQQGSGDQSLPPDVVQRGSRSLFGGRQSLPEATQHLRDDFAARGGSVERYTSIPGRDPIGSTFRRPELGPAMVPDENGVLRPNLWRQVDRMGPPLAPPNGRLWIPPGERGDEAQPPEGSAARDRRLRQQGAPSSRSDQAQLLRGQIDVLQGDLNSRTLDPEQTQRTSEALQELRRQYEALRDPIQAANEQARDQAGLFRVAAGAARELASAELQARESARRNGADTAGQDAAAAEARSTAQTRLAGELNDSIATMERERTGILASVVAQRDGAAATREAEVSTAARTEALKYGAAGTAAYEAAVQRLTTAMRGLKSAQDQAAMAPLIQTQQRQVADIERQRGLIGATALERAQSDAEAAARERLRASNRPVSGEAADAYVSEERRRAESQLTLQREQAGYDELGRIGESAFDRIGQAATQSSLNGVKGLDLLRNTGNAVASELTQAFLKLALLNPLKNAISGGNAPTLTDVVGRLFGGSAAAVGASASAAAPVYGGLYHTGGMMGLEPTSFRTVDPAWFINAPRFHSGHMPSLGVGEIPAVIRDDEGVFTPEQMRNLAPIGAIPQPVAAQGGDVHFNIDFKGDAGSPDDRARLIEGLRTVVRQEIGQASPGIVNAATAQVADLSRRGGSYSRDVGRR